MAAKYSATYPSAMKCLPTDQAGLTAYLRFPAEHHRIRHSNFIERTFGETRRRTKVIGRLPARPAASSSSGPRLPRLARVNMTSGGLRLLQDLRRSLLAPPRQFRPRTVTTSQPAGTGFRTPPWRVINELFTDACRAVLATGKLVAPGACPPMEVLGACFCLTDPRRRFVAVPPVRVLNPAFAAAEAMWILSGSDDPWIYNYNQRLTRYADHGRLMGAYGPRLRRWHRTADQLRLLQEGAGHRHSSGHRRIRFARRSPAQIGVC